MRPDHPGSQAWYDSLLALLADWGVDFVKVDDVLYPPIRRLHLADLGLPQTTRHLTDLWTGERIAVVDGWWEMNLPAHGCVIAAAA